MPFEIFLALLAFAFFAVLPTVVMVVAIIAFVRSRHIGELSRRVEHLEAIVRRESLGEQVELPPMPTEQPVQAEVVSAEEPAEIAEVTSEQIAVQEFPPVPERRPIQWELLIGQKAFGWIAVVLAIFAAAFFLRYAFENNWIGPLGRVAIGCVIGSALVVAGWRQHVRGWRVFSQMLTAAGIVILYLSTYGAFGFYRLLPQHLAGIFLAIIVIESMVAAVHYNSLAIALTAVLGGLLTPVLMVSEIDSYVSLFMYLTVLNIGVVVVMLARGWPAIGTTSFLGTQWLFWSWYIGNYHSEKMGWALAFQIAIYGIYLGHGLGVHLWRQRPATLEDLARSILVATLWFTAFYVMLNEDHGVWMGSASVIMAIAYALVSHLILTWQPFETRQLLTSLAIAIGFVALAFPIQADYAWVALGWAAMTATLWWFGQRVEAPALRIMSTVIGVFAVGRLLIIDIPENWHRDLFIPILNGFALPSIGVAGCVLAGVVATRPFLERLGKSERVFVAFCGVVGVVLLWFVLSVDFYGYFKAYAQHDRVDRLYWRWMGQLSLSILWAVYSAVILALGFRLNLSRLRWIAICFFGLTVVKVFIVDMAGLDELFRIAAFFMLAVILGLAAYAYQRTRLDFSQRVE